MPSTTDPPKRYRLTVRARLALTYVLLATGAGIVMLLVVAIITGFLPNYGLASISIQAQPAAPLGEASYDEGWISAVRGAEAIHVTSRGDVLNLLLISAGVVLVVLGIGGAVAGWMISGRILRPLSYVNAAAARAAKGEFDHRIALVGPRDEISGLANTVDGMLAELETSFDAYRRFAANASHELRTPLATTRAILDVALAGAPGRQRTMLEQLRETNERSIATVDALLDLAEIEAVSPELGAVRLDAVVAEAIEDARPAAIDRELSIDARLEQATVLGDAVLLRQLAGNLLQNAIRHNHDGGFVRVGLVVDGEDARLEVSNGGDDIPADAIAALTDPFTRASGRTNAAGRGLGLSIVSAIVTRHGGGLDIAGRDGGGLRVTVTLPVAVAGDPLSSAGSRSIAGTQVRT